MQRLTCLDLELAVNVKEVGPGFVFTQIVAVAFTCLAPGGKIEEKGERKTQQVL